MTKLPTTPLLPIGDSILLKFECNNPGGSHKTRAARRIIQKGIESGEIIPGVTTVIEKTGGNFGFGLIVACQEYRVPVELVVGLSFSKLKKRCLSFSGAELVGIKMLDEGLQPVQVIESFMEDSTKDGKHYFYPDQFNNQINTEAHEFDTGAELVQQLRRISNVESVKFVACAGTGASITGITRALKKGGFTVEIVLVEPQGCDSKNNLFVEHEMEGMAVGVSPPLIDWDIINDRVFVGNEEMRETQKWYLQKSGYFIGNTSAACLSVARRLEKNNNSNKQKIVSIVYDLGHWYMSAVGE